jgi:hypothetical protein
MAVHEHPTGTRDHRAGGIFTPALPNGRVVVRAKCNSALPGDEEL